MITVIQNDWIRRAAVVKTVLVERFKIIDNRLSINGYVDAAMIHNPKD